MGKVSGLQGQRPRSFCTWETLQLESTQAISQVLQKGVMETCGFVQGQARVLLRETPLVPAHLSSSTPHSAPSWPVTRKESNYVSVLKLYSFYYYYYFLMAPIRAPLFLGGIHASF